MTCSSWRAKSSAPRPTCSCSCLARTACICIRTTCLTCAGALVASSYALTLANQPEIPGGEFDRAAPATVPEHVRPGHLLRHAHTRGASGSGDSDTATLDSPASGQGLPYPCSKDALPGLAQTCVPVAPASISVVGEDAYWTLPDAGGVPPPPLVGSPAHLRHRPPFPRLSTLHAAPLPPIPPQFADRRRFSSLVIVAAASQGGGHASIASLGDPKLRTPRFSSGRLVRPLVPLRDERWRCRPAPLRAHGLFRAAITR